jgi:transcriptional/translational regulatory protein YebC/TACO1
MLLLNYELRVYTEKGRTPLTTDQANAVTREMDTKIQRMVDTLNNDDRVHVVLTNV